MDFKSLSRRELQALCKKNKIPANITNVAMIDALSSLEKVEGFDELMNATKSEQQQSPVKDAPGSPANSQTACRTLTRRKGVAVEPEGSQLMSRTRRSTRRMVAAEESSQDKENVNLPETPAAPTTGRRAAAASVGRKLETQVAEIETLEISKGEAQDNLPETPAPQSSRRRAPKVSALKKQEARKEMSSVQGVYSTRRSVRLLEKSMGNLSLIDNEKDEYADNKGLNNENGDVEEKEENEPGVDLVIASEDSSLTDANMLITKNFDASPEVDCESNTEQLEINQDNNFNVKPKTVSEKSNFSVDSSGLDAEDEDGKEITDLSSLVPTYSSEKAADAVCGPIGESAMKEELQVDSQNNDCKSTDVKEPDVSVIESTSASNNTDLQSVMEEFLNGNKDSFAQVMRVETSTEIMEQLAGSEISKPDAINNSMKVEDLMAENEQHGYDGSDTKLNLNGKLDGSQPDEDQLSENMTGHRDEVAERESSELSPDGNCKELSSDVLLVDSSATMQLGDSLPTTKMEKQLEYLSAENDTADNCKKLSDVLSIESSATVQLRDSLPTTNMEMQLEGLSAEHDIEGLVNVDITEAAFQAYDSEKTSRHLSVPDTEVESETTVQHNLQQNDDSKTLIDVPVKQAEDYSIPHAVVNQSRSTPSKSFLSETKKEMAASPFAADTLQGQFPRPTTESTPRKASTGKQMITHSLDIINKENIDNSGMKLKDAKKGVDQYNKKLEDMSMRMLNKMLKEKLQIRNKSAEEANNADVIGEKAEKKRPALQTLTEKNYIPSSAEPENKNH